jgi:hypothetical protein
MEGHGKGCMTQELRDGGNVRPIHDELACEGVPEVVEVEIFDLRLTACGCKRPSHFKIAFLEPRHLLYLSIAGASLFLTLGRLVKDIGHVNTLKKKPLRYDNLKDFIASYNPLNRHKRKETWDASTNPEGRWRMFTRDQIVARDKTSLDIFWLKDKSLADLDNLPEPVDIAGEIIENVETGLNSFRIIIGGLS